MAPLKKQTNTSRPTVGCLTITVVTKFGIADLQRRPQPPCQSLAAKNRFCLRVLPAPPFLLAAPFLPSDARAASERASEHPDLSARGVRPFQPAPKSHHSNHLPQPITAMLLRSPGKAARSSLAGDFRLWALRLPSLPRCDRQWQSIGLLQFHKNRRKK